MESLSIDRLQLKIDEYKELILILVLSIITRFSFLHRPELRSWDEAVHATVARSLLSNPLKPVLITYPIPGLENVRGFPHIFLEKPPLIFWLMAISYKIFGINEFAVRFFPAVFGVLSVILTYLLAKQFFEKKVALFSSLLLSLCQFHVKYSRQGMLDVPIALFALLTLLLFIKGYNSKTESSIFFILAGISQGLGILTKWHAAIFPTIAIILFICLQKRWEFLFSRNILYYFTSVVLSTLPWLVYMYMSFPEATRALILFEISGRPFIASERGPFWYFSQLMWGLTPWGPIVLSAVIYSIWKRTSGDLLLLPLIVATFLAFDISAYKLSFYIIPIFPFLLILTARFILTLSYTKEKTIFLLVISLIASLVYVFLSGAFPNTLVGIDQLWLLMIITTSAVLYYLAIWVYVNKTHISHSKKFIPLLLLLPLFASNLAFTGADIYTDISHSDMGVKEMSFYIKNHTSKEDLIFSSPGIGWAIIFYAERSTYEFHVLPNDIFENYILTRQVKFVVISDAEFENYETKSNFVLLHSIEVHIPGVSPSLHVYSMI